MLDFFRTLSLPRTHIVAFIGGALNVLAFAPFFIWPLQILSLAWLFAMQTLRPELNKKQVASIGFCYAFGTMFFGVSWLVVAMNHYGDMPMALALIALALLASYMSIFAAAFAAASHYLRARWKISDAAILLLILPALWGASEWLRGILFTGFPWLSFGYAHSDNMLSGFASVVGVYGLNYVVAFIAGTVALGVLDQAWRWRAIGLYLTLSGMGIGLSYINWTEPSGNEISVRLIQTNVNQGEKFSSAYVENLLNNLANQVREKPADLIAIPETAIPLVLADLDSVYLANLHQFSQTTNSHLALGTVMSDGPNSYANSVVGFAPGQSLDYRYDKHHLVPFGEFVPFGFRWFVDMLHIPLGDLTAPKNLQAPMRVRDQTVMPNICYEDLFGDEIAAQLRAQSASKQGAATILLNVSNLAWYDDSIAIPQHLQISQMRALETGRPMLRATNTGATAIINAHGKVIAHLPSLTKGSLDGRVQGMQGLTPYLRFGELIWMSLVGLSLLLAYYLGKSKTQ